MQRRLNIACGVLHDPKILLLDEPTIGVDPQSRERILEMLQELHRNGVSILLTTHQLDEAQKVCQRLVIIDNGKRIAAGTFEELLDQTIGKSQTLSMTMDKEIPDNFRETGFSKTSSNTFDYKLESITPDLQYIANRVTSAGMTIEKLSIKTPSLQDVFIHLTGRDLRQ